MFLFSSPVTDTHWKVVTGMTDRMAFLCGDDSDLEHFWDGQGQDETGTGFGRGRKGEEEELEKRFAPPALLFSVPLPSSSCPSVFHRHACHSSSCQPPTSSLTSLPSPLSLSLTPHALQPVPGPLCPALPLPSHPLPPPPHFTHPTTYHLPTHTHLQLPTTTPHTLPACPHTCPHTHLPTHTLPLPVPLTPLPPYSGMGDGGWGGGCPSQFLYFERHHFSLSLLSSSPSPVSCLISSLISHSHSHSFSPLSSPLLPSHL